MRGIVTPDQDLMHLEWPSRAADIVSAGRGCDGGPVRFNPITARILASRRPAPYQRGRPSLSGHYDLQADLETNGTTQLELVQNLKGTFKLEARNGKVMKFALLGNILKMKNISNLLQKGGPKIDDKGFPYKKLVIDGHVQYGRFVVDNGAPRYDERVGRHRIGRARGP